MLKNIVKDNLSVEIYETRAEMGKAAAMRTVAKIKELMETKDTINMIFAAAPSQNEVLEGLVNSDVDWSRVNAFHMDEYIGLGEDAPQGFGNFLKNAIFGKVNFKSVNYIFSDTKSSEEICRDYAKLIEDNPIDIVCLGIGENGHIAFNDPWVAEFDDKEIIKKVALDEVCRQQQVNDGCFKSIDDVPKYALTLTVPTLFNADYLFCTVPAHTKANAVYNTVNADINEDVPATIMRNHKNAVMFCDKDSGAKLL